MYDMMKYRPETRTLYRYISSLNDIFTHISSLNDIFRSTRLWDFTPCFTVKKSFNNKTNYTTGMHKKFYILRLISVVQSLYRSIGVNFHTFFSFCLRIIEITLPFPYGRVRIFYKVFSTKKTSMDDLRLCHLPNLDGLFFADHSK